MNAYPRAEYLQRLAIAAGEVMKRNFTLGMQREWKSDNTPVTESDTAINRNILECFLRDYPHVCFIGEEESRILSGAEYTVFCDPVDGTIPFCLGIPIASFCISVVKDGVPCSAVIYDPFMNRMWSADRGEGARLNGRSVSVSNLTTLSRSNIGMCWWRGSRFNLHGICEKLMDAGAKWMNPCSMAYFGGLTASGEIDATVFPAKKALETAAMDLIVTEAGGRATDIYGNALRYEAEGEIDGHVISNGHLHDELLRIAEECR